LQSGNDSPDCELSGSIREDALKLDGIVAFVLDPADDAQVAFQGFDHGRAILDPVAAVQIVRAEEGAVRGVLDVAADDAVGARGAALRPPLPPRRSR
jgi:hypothetical protein